MAKDKGYVLCYDRCQIPDGMTMKDVIKRIMEKSECIYDGSKGTKKPTIVHLGGSKNNHLLNLKFIDINKSQNQ